MDYRHDLEPVRWFHFPRPVHFQDSEVSELQLHPRLQ